MSFTAADLARRLDGEIVGDPATLLRHFAPAETAQPGDLTFAENENYFAKAEASAASAVLVGKTVLTSSKVLIRVANPRLAFAQVLPLFFPEPQFTPGIHATAVVAASAKVDPTAHIGPHCVVGERSVLGARVVLQGGNHLGADCAVGDDTNLFPNVTVYARTQIGRRVRVHAGTVIGADGFGYVFDAGVHRKVPQVGHVILGDDVELGANVTIDRGALGPTIIGKGSKVDNLVQIAHNVVIGEHCIVCAQTGIAGSVTLGNYVVVGGQAGFNGHIKIGDRATIAAQSGVMRDVPPGEKLWGTPAQPDRQFKRQHLALQQLPELLRRVAKLEKKPEAE
ncbi:MAG: UDP-3-O-(3-hydroxymyristoyl)glucosamine N-acyltransferase [Verrucomicrobiota bacterium]|jgi:UDP-3-O-[3-hydroxymyristoyl] glucosamine N-acyltransferase